MRSRVMYSSGVRPNCSLNHLKDAHELYQVPRAIQAGRVWVNCYHAYPAHAPFGGYKKSGFGRETHKMMLNHYRQTKNMLISYSKTKLGFF
jgi:aldehyde dehydrogenase